jgi:hypothetical protein
MRRNQNFKKFPRNKKTGEIFDSIYEAAIFFKVSHQTIINYCNGDVGANKMFEKIDLEWVSIQEIAREMRVLRDDIDFYKNGARFKSVEATVNAQ